MGPIESMAYQCKVYSDNSKNSLVIKTHQDPANMPKCGNLRISKESLLQRPRLVKIEGVMGSESELKLMEIVLKNAVVWISQN
ncbi:hypothetical protein Syun_016974 [Stephania yunnanensis]|uniref:Uncharacterized protein n=1 Tax=Stephania yunnanensis TaxID=152371 RepID=A0AAP0J8E8_9MAGN